MDNIKDHPLYGRHTIDSAMTSLWSFYKARFIPLFLISLVISLIIQYASTFMNINELQKITDPELIFEKMKEMIAPMAVILVINLLFSVVLQYYVIFNPVSSTGIFQSLLKSARFFIPALVLMIVLSLFATIALVLGIIALVVGVFFAIIYILMIYFFILPILMIEDQGIMNTITRTSSLAHRNFWSNIGWVSVFIIIFIVFSLILSGIILLPFTGSFIKTIFNPENADKVTELPSNPLFLILSAVANALTLPLIPVFSCILYFNSRAGEEEQKIKIQPVPEDTRPRIEDLYPEYPPKE